MKKKISLYFLLILPFFATPQYKIGQWVDYLPYNSVRSVAKGNGKVYAATGSGLFALNLSDNSLERLNKIYGLSDVGVTLVRFNNYNNTLIIVYGNSNIDVIKDGNVVNVSDIKRKNITSSKTVYNVSFYQQYAYISTAFGICVFDTDRLEFKDTYIIGANGTYLDVYDVASDGNVVFAATANGLKRAAFSANLANYQNWSNDPGLPAGAYNFVVKVKNVFVANYSSKLTNGVNYDDTLYVYNNAVWETFPKYHLAGASYSLNSLLVDDATQRLMIVDQWQLEEWQFNGSTFLNYGGRGGNVNISDQNGNPIWTNLREGIYVPELGNGYYALAMAGIGLVKTDGIDYARIMIDGPDKNFVSQIAILKDKMVIAPSWLTLDVTNSYQRTGIYTMTNGVWKNVMKNPLSNTVVDINSVTFLNKDPNHYFAGSWGNGVLEFINDTLYKIHNESNTGPSGLQPAVTTTNSVRISGLVSDTSGNLWVTNSFNGKILSVRKPDASWQHFDFAQYVNATNSVVAEKILIDRNNQKWMLIKDAGFIVYNDGGTYATPGASNTKRITTAVGSGGLPSGSFFSMCEDKDGDIWVGCDKGIAVFYNPESILSTTSGWDAQQIIIDQNGVAKILLETESVLDIVVDGENRKWVATYSGVYCLSADGQKEIYHFTVDNSPLFSNSVIDLEYNGKTGDIFIGTLEGVQSYRTEVIDAFEDFTDVYSYPNPVKPGYDGPVVIKGMVEDAVVKITDITGALVYETKSKGGQAIWYAKNFKGERVASGVYVVFCSSSDGEQKTLTKILVVN